ncbi:MAG: PIN domain-containing protein [Alphaproteobacteria bacterium]|nr:PIN domain-containing protein [Alphaproteobacteria bacterium]
MSGRVFLDTNVLVYLHDSDAPDKQRQARELVSELARERRAVVSTQVLQEFFVVVTRKLGRPLPVAEAEAQVRRFATWPVARTDADLVLEAISLHRELPLSFWDALIVAAARREACDRVFSEDLGDGTTYAGVTVHNPFA